jgi:hypothetical protein
MRIMQAMAPSWEGAHSETPRRGRWKMWESGSCSPKREADKGEAKLLLNNDYSMRELMRWGSLRPASSAQVAVVRMQPSQRPSASCGKTSYITGRDQLRNIYSISYSFFLHFYFFIPYSYLSCFLLPSRFIFRLQISIVYPFSILSLFS